MARETITRGEVAAYKKEVLESSTLVRLDAAAAILGVSTRSVLRRVAEGRITAYNDNSTNKNIRFLASELQRYVREMGRRTQES